LPSPRKNVGNDPACETIWRAKRSPAGAQALFPAGRVFLQGYFADGLRDGDSNAISWLWRNGL
jgi:hypothetical protein